MNPKKWDRWLRIRTSFGYTVPNYLPGSLPGSPSGQLTGAHFPVISSIASLIDFSRWSQSEEPSTPALWSANCLPNLGNPSVHLIPLKSGSQVGTASGTTQVEGWAGSVALYSRSPLDFSYAELLPPIFLSLLPFLFSKRIFKATLKKNYYTNNIMETLEF